MGKSLVPVTEKSDSEKSPAYKVTTKDEENKGSQNLLSYSGLWSNFKAKTTSHWMAPIVEATGLVKKVTWTIVILVMTGLMINNLRKIITEYSQRPVNVVIKMERKSDLVFPAVTFCNINPTRKSQLYKLPALGDVLHHESESRKKRKSLGCPSSISGRHTNEWQGRCIHISSNTYISAKHHETQCKRWFGSTATGLVLATQIAGDAFNAVHRNGPGWSNTSNSWNLALTNTGDSWEWADGRQASCEQPNNCSYLNWECDCPEGPSSSTPFAIIRCEKNQDCVWNGAMKSELGLMACQFPMPQASTTAPLTTTTTATTSTSTQSTSPAETTQTDMIVTTVPLTTEVEQTDPPTTTPEAATISASTLAGTTTVEDITVPLTTQKLEEAAAPNEEEMNFGAADESLGEQTEEFKVLQKFTETLAGASTQEKLPLGHQREDFILECSFRGRQCKNTSAMFSSFFSPTYGNCYTFNSGVGKDEEGLLKSYKSGRQYGLKLTLDIEVDDYVTDLADSAGVRVLITNPYYMPFVEDEGITLSPGRANLIGIKKVLIEHLDDPYSDCLLELQNQEEVDAYQENYHTDYTTQACQKTCYQAAVISQCGCADALYPTSGKALNIPDHLNQSHPPICHSTNKKDVLCRKDVATRFEANKLDCGQCRNPCSEEHYKYSLSSSIWPSEGALEQTTDHLSTISPKVAGIRGTDEFRESYLKVNVYYEDLNQEAYSERPAVPFDTMMANLGGSLGLFIGMSAVTAFEVFELLADVLVLTISKAKNRNKAISPNDQP